MPESRGIWHSPSQQSLVESVLRSKHRPTLAFLHVLTEKTAKLCNYFVPGTVYFSADDASIQVPTNTAEAAQVVQCHPLHNKLLDWE